MTRYEYKFVRLGEGWLAVRREGREGYREVVERHARDGWRLVQIFAPGVGGYGAAKYIEVVLERELPAGAASTPPQDQTRARSLPGE
jgi:hypothetical protein